MKSWLEISEERLAANYALLTEAANPDPVIPATAIPATAILAVIKADAYGHGAALCANILAHAGAPWLGVTDAAEGELVLQSLSAATNPPPKLPSILIMSGLLPEDAPTILRHRLIPTVWHPQQLDWLLNSASRDSAGGKSISRDDETIPIHIEIDTGMSRQGAAPGSDLDALITCLKSHPQLRLDGVFTHFASAEVAGCPQTKTQRASFEQAIAAIAKSGLRPAWVHAGNSSTLDTELTEATLPWLRNLASTLGARSMVRAGLALYGYCLPIESTAPSNPAVRPHLQPHLQPNQQPNQQPNLRPVLTWKTRISGLRDLPPGAAIGYNGIFTAQRPTRLALLPVGYADGLRRELSASNTQPGGWAIVHGRRAPIVGRISMNLTTLDVTDIPNVSLGDEVILLGEGITAADHARLAHTIPYEILCPLRASVLPDGPATLSHPTNEDLFAGTPVRAVTS